MGFEHDPHKIVWTEAYQNQDHLNQLGWSLISFGAHQFKGATIIMRLTEMEKAVGARHAGETSMEAFAKFLEPFMWEQLIDDIRICTFYENYMKAVLLFKGAIIHKFKPVGSDHGKFKALKRAQEKDPLGVVMITSKNITEAEISPHTITMDLMLSDSYQRVIGLEEEARRLITTINDRRNKLHFHNSLTIELSEEILRGYRALNAQVDYFVGLIYQAQNQGKEPT